MAIEKLSFDIKHQHSLTDINYINSKLVEFNNQKLGLPINNPGPQPVTVLLKNENDEVVGGAYASAYLNVFHIYACWIDEKYRGQGYGRLMDKKLQQEAERFNCHTATMETHSFQLTKNFYNKVGVLFINKIKNSPIGHTKYFLINKLDKDKSLVWKIKNFIQTYIFK